MVPALCLSDDLWAKIFSLYATDATYHQHGLRGIHHDVRSKKLYYRYQELRLVCKRFNKLMDQSEESNTLLLWEKMDGLKLSSLIRWIQSRSSTLRGFVANCPSFTQDAALTAAVPAPCSGASSLETIFLCAPSDYALRLLSKFSNLAKFVLNDNTDKDGILDLSALKFLMKLSDLRLEDSTFSIVGELAHLTSLYLYRAMTSVGQCHFHLCLQKLDLRESQLAAMPSNGVAACLALQSLACVHSKVCQFGGRLCWHFIRWCTVSVTNQHCCFDATYSLVAGVEYVWSEHSVCGWTVQSNKFEKSASGKRLFKPHTFWRDELFDSADTTITLLHFWSEA